MATSDYVFIDGVKTPFPTVGLTSLSAFAVGNKGFFADPTHWVKTKEGWKQLNDPALAAFNVEVSREPQLQTDVQTGTEMIVDEVILMKGLRKLDVMPATSAINPVDSSPTQIVGPCRCLLSADGCGSFPIPYVLINLL